MRYWSCHLVAPPGLEPKPASNSPPPASSPGDLQQCGGWGERQACLPKAHSKRTRHREVTQHTESGPKFATHSGLQNQTGSSRTLPTGLQNSTSLSSLKETTTHRRDQLEVQSANSGSCEKQLWKEPSVESGLGLCPPKSLSITVGGTNRGKFKFLPSASLSTLDLSFLTCEILEGNRALIH